LPSVWINRCFVKDFYGWRQLFPRYLLSYSFSFCVWYQRLSIFLDLLPTYKLSKFSLLEEVVWSRQTDNEHLYREYTTHDRFQRLIFRGFFGFFFVLLKWKFARREWMKRKHQIFVVLKDYHQCRLSFFIEFNLYKRENIELCESDKNLINQNVFIVIVCMIEKWKAKHNTKICNLIYLVKRSWVRERKTLTRHY
jgi:hypothetical protein